MLSIVISKYFLGGDNVRTSLKQKNLSMVTSKSNNSTDWRNLDLYATLSMKYAKEVCKSIKESIMNQSCLGQVTRTVPCNYFESNA